MSNWNRVALEGWLLEVLRVQTHDASIVLADGKTEAAVGMRGSSVVLLSYDDEPQVLAQIDLVPR